MKHALPMALALVGVGVLATLSGPYATGPKAVYAATAVRPGGFNPDPSMRPWRWADGPNPNGWFCRPPNCMGYATDGTQFVDNEIALMAATGAKYLRVEFPWFSIEPGNGTYDWSRTDYIINAAVAKGLITQPVLVYTPKWSSSYAANPPGAVSDWTTFVTAIVNRYKANVHYWEMWNEPDLNQYWNSSTANYVSQILAPGYGAVHAADPSAKVIVGPSNPSWYGNLLPAGAKGYFDIAAYHAYNGGALGGSSTVKSFLNGAGINVPIWVGEYGLEENTIHDTGQTGLLTGALTGVAPVDVVIWYSIRDDNSATCCPPVGVHPQFYGLVQFDGVTKKDGYAVMTQLLGGTIGPPPPASRGAYKPLPPARIMDTRTGAGGVPVAPLGPGGTLDVQITGQQGVPSSGVSAVVLNVTATNTSAPGYLTVYPAGVARPLASSLNWAAGQTVPNLVEVAVSTAGKVTIFNFAGLTDVLFDVAGYVATTTGTPGPDGLLTPLVPARILDTRSGTGGSTIGPGQTIDVPVAGNGGVPSSGVAAVVLNVTATNPTASGYLTAFPAGVTRPLASNLNFLAGQTVPNRVIVKVGNAGKVSFYNFSGTSDVVADVGGWFTDASNPAATGSAFSGLTPARILDTRVASPLGPAGTLSVQVAGLGGVPLMTASPAPTAVVLNVTVTNPTANSYLTVWPQGTSQPLASDLNWRVGQTVPNLVVVKLGPTGMVSLYNLAGTSHVVIDVVGWYS
jgi:hypothetical protein